MRRILGVVVLLIGLAAVVVGITAFVRAAPTSLHCARSTQTCVWQEPRMLGGARDVTLSLGELHDSQVTFEASKNGLATTWIVGQGEGTFELGSSTLNTHEGDEYERLARELQQFLRSRQPAFDAEFATGAGHWSLVLALAGAFVAACGAYLVTRRGR